MESKRSNVRLGVRILVITLATLTIITAALLIGSKAAGAAGRQAQHTSHAFHCVKPMRTDRRESLLQWSRKTGITPALELKVIALCSYPHGGGWTQHIANLLAGKYGPNYQTAKLPAHTLLWNQLP